MGSVRFHRPQSVAEAVGLLAEDEGARPLAGGASIVAMLNAKLVTPTAIVSLRDIAELRRTGLTSDGQIRIGAMTRHRESAENAALSGTLACVRLAAGNIANPPVRNMGTMGGSVSLADPAADYSPALVAVGATIEITGKRGTRLVPAENFFVDWYTTALQPGELVTAILLPSPRIGRACYHKLARVAGDFAVVSIAISAAEDGAVSVAVGGCGPRPVVNAEANGLLSRNLADLASVRSAGQLLANQSDPVDDVRASAEYRRMVIPRMLERAAADVNLAPERTA